MKYFVATYTYHYDGKEWSYRTFAKGSDIVQAEDNLKDYIAEDNNQWKEGEGWRDDGTYNTWNGEYITIDTIVEITKKDYNNILKVRDLLYI